MTDDATLLRHYADDRSQEAMAELVRRHIGLVYHTALRLCGGDHHRAQDVAQSVFVDLAHKAGKLARHEALTGWLYTSTRYASVQAIRAAARRQVREQEAHMIEQAAAGDPATNWEQVRPVIDDALGALSERDRNAVLMRFFEARAFAEIGAESAISEDAARMRVDRALDKLRRLLAERGITSTAAALGLTLSAQAGAAVPAEVVTIATAAAVSGTAAGSVLVAAGLFTMTKLQVGVGLAIVGAGCAGLLWQHHRNTVLEARVAELHAVAQENAHLRAQVAKLTAIPVGAPTASPSAPPPAASQMARAQTEHAIKPSTVPLADGLAPVDKLGNGGHATPRTAFATQLWAARAGDVELEASVIMLTPAGQRTLLELLTKLPPDIATRYDTPEKLMAFALAGSPHPVGGMQVLGETDEGPDDVVLQTRWQHIDDDIVHDTPVHLHRTPDGWKMVVPTVLVDRAAAYLGRED